jgi:hypothetical protein
MSTITRNLWERFAQYRGALGVVKTKWSTTVFFWTIQGGHTMEIVLSGCEGAMAALASRAPCGRRRARWPRRHRGLAAVVLPEGERRFPQVHNRGTEHTWYDFPFIRPSAVRLIGGLYAQEDGENHQEAAFSFGRNRQCDRTGPGRCLLVSIRLRGRRNHGASDKDRAGPDSDC